MNLRQKSQRGFVAVTLITVLSIALVLVVYATLLGTFTGGDVTVGGVGDAEITYSLTDLEAGPWSTTLDVGSVGTPWYARAEITVGDYNGPVTITWILEQETAPGSWSTVATYPDYTSVTLTGSIGQLIYATSDGAFLVGTNLDWDADVGNAGTYHVIATINTPA